MGTNPIVHRTKILPEVNPEFPARPLKLYQQRKQAQTKLY